MWNGQVSRSSSLAKTILRDRVKQRRRQGRQIMRWDGNIKEWTGLEFAKSQTAVENREKWRKLVVKLFVVPQRPLRLRNRCRVKLTSLLCYMWRKWKWWSSFDSLGFGVIPWSVFITVRCVFIIRFYILFLSSVFGSPFLSPQWGAADVETKTPSVENTELKGFLLKVWSSSIYSHTCYACCQEFLPC